jgi:hypothetical protein
VSGKFAFFNVEPLPAPVEQTPQAMLEAEMLRKIINEALLDMFRIVSEHQAGVPLEDEEKLAYSDACVAFIVLVNLQAGKITREYALEAMTDFVGDLYTDVEGQAERVTFRAVWEDGREMTATAVQVFQEE